MVAFRYIYVTLLRYEMGYLALSSLIYRRYCHLHPAKAAYHGALSIRREREQERGDVQYDYETFPATGH